MRSMVWSVLALCTLPLSGCAREASAERTAVSARPGSAPGVGGSRDAAARRAVAASELLAALPDGEERRRFILDCTGCHTFRADLAYPGGAPRSEESWASAIGAMIARFGAHSGFPVIGPDRDPAALAEWLARSLPATPPQAQHDPSSMQGRADYREYVLPVAGDLPHDVALYRDSVIITGMFTNQLYILDPATGAVRTEPTPAPNPRAIEIDGDGNWWVVLGGPQRVARRSPDGAWTTYPAGFYAHSVALGADGAVWVNGHFTHEPELIRRIDTVLGAHEDFEVPAHPGFGTTTVPYEIRVAPDGAVWMSELQGNRLVRLDAGGGFDVWSMPLSWSGPRRLDIDTSGIVWIPEYSANRLTRFDPATEQFESFELPIAAAAPYIARYDRARDAIWIGTGAADAVVRFDVATRTFRVYALPSVDQLVRHLVVDDASGDIWLAPGSSPGTTPARVVRLRPLD